MLPGSVTGSGPPAATIINISDVTGLQNALNVRAVVGTGFGTSRSAVIDATGAIDAAVGNLGDCLHVDGTSGPCSTFSTTFIDGEGPAGTLDGSNASFLLANVPNPASSLALYRNGLLLRQGGDYTLANNTVTFLTGAVPQPNDILIGLLPPFGEHSGSQLCRPGNARRRDQRGQCRLHAQPKPQPQLESGPLPERCPAECRCRLHCRRPRYNVPNLSPPIRRHVNLLLPDRSVSKAVLRVFADPATVFS